MAKAKTMAAAAKELARVERRQDAMEGTIHWLILTRKEQLTRAEKLRLAVVKVVGARGQARFEACMDSLAKISRGLNTFTPAPARAKKASGR